MSAMIIPVQSNENASEAIQVAANKKIKKIKKSTPSSSSVDKEPIAKASISEANMTEANMTEAKADSESDTAHATKTARKTFSKYCIQLKSISCLVHILTQVAEYYPIESARYFNNFRYKQLNAKTSECECTFQSHLSTEELMDIFRQNPNDFVKEASANLRLMKKKAGATEDEAEDESV